MMCFCLFAVGLQAEKTHIEDGALKKEHHSSAGDSSSDLKLAGALENLQHWISNLEKELPKEVDKSAEKLLAALDKPSELSSKLWDVLAQSEQQFEPDEKTVFGEKLEKFSLEERRRLVIAWTAELQKFLRKRAVSLSENLAQSGNAKGKELSEAVRKLSQAHFEGYEEYKKSLKTSQNPKLFCFACDGHIGDFNYHESMEEQVKKALAGWSSSPVSGTQTAAKNTEEKSNEKKAADKNSGATQPSQGSFEKYRTTLVNGKPNPNMYPQPENMAPVLGLTSPEGYSYLKWKGPGQHFANSPQGKEYGVQVDWNLIKQQNLEEQKRVLKIMEDILRAGVQPFKVVRPNNDGYCIWCNLGNYGPSKAEIASLRGRVSAGS
jgi:hypothetical protein